MISFLEEIILSDIVSKESFGENEKVEEFSINNLEREPHSDWEDEADFMKSIRKEECLK